MPKELGKRTKTQSVYIGAKHFQKLEVISAKISGGSLYPAKPSQVIQWIIDELSDVVIEAMIKRINENKKTSENTNK